jgi:hypothetical protein
VWLMRGTRSGAAVLVLALSGCAATTHTNAKGASICKEMEGELTTLNSISTSIHLQQVYATPLDAANAIGAVQAIMTATAQNATADHLNDLATPFAAMIVDVQAFQANVLDQDATAEPGVVSQVQTGDANIRTACAPYTS